MKIVLLSSAMFFLFLSATAGFKPDGCVTVGIMKYQKFYYPSLNANLGLKMEVKKILSVNTGISLRSYFREFENTDQEMNLFGYGALEFSRYTLKPILIVELGEALST